MASIISFFRDPKPKIMFANVVQLVVYYSWKEEIQYHFCSLKDLTSLFDANFSHAVTHNSIASVLISSFMSECWGKEKHEKANQWVTEDMI